jgi:uncharacterized protein with HEPN domain
VNSALRTKDFLGHILEAIDRIESYTLNLDQSGFEADVKTQDAVIRNMEIVGEACSNIRKHTPDFAKSHPEVPWGNAIGNRNALSHGYFSVDLTLVWATAQNDLPKLKKAIEPLFASQT